MTSSYSDYGVTLSLTTSSASPTPTLIRPPAPSNSLTCLIITKEWDGFKKVILTNKGADGAEVVKEIYALDPEM